MTDRYNRQELIKNWDQSQLEKARVAIVGVGELAHFTAASLAALGIGKIDIYDNGERSDGFLTAGEEDEGIGTLEKKLNAINPDIDVRGKSTALEGRADIVIDLTNSKESKRKALEYAGKVGATAISASTDKTGGEFYVLRDGEQDQDAELEMFDGTEQGHFSSTINGGMITEEVRKTLMPLYEGESPARRVAYNATAERRFGEPEFEPSPTEDLSGKRVLIVGAGALGNFVALNAALEGIGHIDILDYDEVESHNLNRQILFYDAIGKMKSTALADRVRKINPNVEVRGIVGKLDENTTYFAESKPDLILDCVDNFATRAITNYFAVTSGIPLVSGGTNSSSGQVVVYEPGETACLDCKLGVEQALGLKLAGASCKDTPDPSVIMTNEVVGGMMVGEALKVLDKGYGAPVDRILKYDSSVSVRGGLVGPSAPCDCERPPIEEWLGYVKSRFSFGERRE